ncbi:MAG: geranylgeranyl reductase family protein [bacterium]
MTKADHYDVIIVGAGPAGSCTAMYVNPKSTGKRVLLLEARQQVGVPVQCGEAMPTYAELLTVFPEADCPELFDFPEEVYAGRIEGLKFKAPSGKEYIADLKGQMFHRDRLDQHLFRQAVENGAEFLLATRVKQIEDNRVHTADRVFSADIIVGADGVFSLVSRCVQEFEANKDVCPCAFVLARGEFNEELIELWFQSRFPGGYFWYFPKNNAGEANIGLGMRGPKNHKGLLKQVLEEIKQHKTFTVKQIGGGAVPLGGLKKKFVHNNVALVGDAAGMVFPTNGGGTGLAMMAGKWLGVTIAQNKPLLEYEKKAKAILGPVLRDSLRTRRQLDFFRKNDRLFSAMMWMANLKGWRSFIIG